MLGMKQSVEFDVVVGGGKWVSSPDKTAVVD